MTLQEIPSFLSAPRPTAIAHRGGGYEAEENTMPAFENAWRLGFRSVELDVHLSADGEVMIHHDATLERIFGRPEAVNALSQSDFSRISSPMGAKVPRLAELIHDFPEMHITIEAKSDAVIGPLVGLLRKAGAFNRCVVGSFSNWRTGLARQLAGPDLCWSPSKEGVARLWSASFGLPFQPEFRVVQVPVRWRGLEVVTPRFLRAAQQRDVQVQVWTVNDAPEMNRLLDMGVDGIMTDRPSLLREVMIRRGVWIGA